MTEAKQTQKKQTEKVNLTGRVQKAAETLQERVKDYNEKYVTKTIEKGRETVRQYNDKYVNKAIEKGKTYVDGPYKKVSGTMDDVLARGRSLEKDAWKKLDAYAASGRKFMYKVPMVETIEKRVSARLNSVPSVVNLPGKNDIDQLTRAMESLNANIESLKKQQAQQ